MSTPDLERAARYFDGTLSEEELAELCAWIKASPAHADQFAQLGLMDRQIDELMDWQRKQAVLDEMAPDDDSVFSEQFMQALQALEGPEAADAIVHLPSLPEKPTPKRRTPAVEPPAPANEKAEHGPVFKLGGLRVYRVPSSGGGIRVGRLMKWAALLALIAAVGWLVWPPAQHTPIAVPDDLAVDPPDAQPPAPPPVLATVLRTQDAVWQAGATGAPVGSIATGSQMHPGRVELAQGFAELAMASGAVVLVEAPATFELLDENRMRLVQGRLVAEVPEQAHLFTVHTATADVVDLGTQFGVEALEDGRTTAAVFDGVIKMAELPADGRSLPREFVLDEGLQVVVESDGVMQEEADAVGLAHDFTVDWDTVVYRPQLEGQVRWLHRLPASLSSTENQFPDFIAVFVERTGVVLDEPLEGWFVGTGEVQGHEVADVSTGVIPAGVAMDGYLIHRDRVPPEGRKNEPLIATLRFPRPIVGIQTQAQQLLDTDAVLGVPESIVYNKEASRFNYRWRGMDATLDSDWFVLSEDRMTLVLSLAPAQKGGGSRDQLRVLVEAAEPPQEPQPTQPQPLQPLGTP